MVQAATETSPNKPLTGKALLKKVKELGDQPKREIAKKCGYYTEKDHQKRAKMTEFYDAVLDAKGIKLDAGKTRDGRGREASYRACVHKNGSLVIGANYTKSMGLEPGDQFEIKLGSKHIHLIQVESLSDGEIDEEE